MTKTKLESFIEQADELFGEGAVLYLEDKRIVNVETIPTGIVSVDEAIGVGGIPRGRITEIFGSNASGKTTLCLQLMANANKLGFKCLFIDVEHAFNLDWAKKIGIDTAMNAIAQPMSGNEALQLVEMASISEDFGVVIVDSVAALIPDEEINKSIGDPGIALLARLMSQAMRKLIPQISKHKTAVVFINQTRANLGVFGFGDKTVTSGGNALRFAASLRIKMSMIGSINSSAGGTKKRVGAKHRITIVKNKLAVPFKEAEFQIRENGIVEA